MGILFRKRIKIAKGVHLNISKSGTSLSVGPRGAKVMIIIIQNKYFAQNMYDFNKR